MYLIICHMFLIYHTLKANDLNSNAIALLGTQYLTHLAATGKVEEHVLEATFIIMARRLE